MLDYEKILNSVQAYVLNYLQNNLTDKLSFHNVNHTIEVVRATREIGSECMLTPLQFFTTQIAAWFHDCGYAKTYAGHEDISKKIAAEFLAEQGCPDKLTNLVLECIEATRYPQDPKNLESQIVCDADLYHFTKPNYGDYEQALRMELRVYFKQDHSDIEWAELNCDLLQAHTYCTEYGKEVLQKFKKINMHRMHCRLQDFKAL